MRRALFLDSFGQTSQALRLCSLVLDANPNENTANYPRDIQEGSTLKTLKELRMALEVFCNMLYEGSLHHETEFLDWFAASNCNRISMVIEASVELIRQNQQESKFSDVAKRITTDLRSSLVEPTDSKKDDINAALVRGSRVRRRDFLRRLEMFIASSDAASTSESGCEVPRVYRKHLSAICKLEGDEGAEEDNLPMGARAGETIGLSHRYR